MKVSGLPRRLIIDSIKWVYWVPLRLLIPLKGPEQVEFTGRCISRLYQHLFPSMSGILMDELRRSFGIRHTEAGYRRMARDSFDTAFQVFTEDFLFHRLSRKNVDRFIFLSGREHLDSVLKRGRGAILVYPHFGSIMLMIASLGFSGYRYTQFAARGTPPEEIARRARSARSSPIERHYLKVREGYEDRLPARFIPLGRGLMALVDALRGNEIVGIALDGRGGGRFTPVRFLNRWALFTTGAIKLASITGAGIVPAVVLRGVDGRNELKVHDEVRISLQEGGEAGYTAALSQILRIFEEYIERFPHLYGWRLLHCRLRADWDDHPFFLDYARDDSWKRYAPPGFRL